MTASYWMCYIDPMRKTKPVTVTLGDMKDRAEARVRSGAYASMSEVVRAGLHALDREEDALNRWMREKIEESLSDPRPSIPAADVFAELRAYHQEQSEADKRGR